MKKIFILLALICLALCMSCKQDDSDNQAQNEIRDIFYDLTLDYNLGNIYGMMDLVDNNYLHKGKITWHLNEEILDRKARFPLLEIEVLYIEINGRFAVAHTIDHYSSSVEDADYNEPEYSGYFSYFHRNQGSWLIYGDQSWIKKAGSDLPSKQREQSLSKAF